MNLIDAGQDWSLEVFEICAEITRLGMCLEDVQEPASDIYLAVQETLEWERITKYSVVIWLEFRFYDWETAHCQKTPINEWVWEDRGRFTCLVIQIPCFLRISNDSLSAMAVEMVEHLLKADDVKVWQLPLTEGI